jgi:hypothetical protein
MPANGGLMPRTVEDINGRPIKLGDLVRQVLYDNGAPIPDTHRREPRRVEAIGSTRGEIVLAGSLQWQAAGRFEKVDQ